MSYLLDSCVSKKMSYLLEMSYLCDLMFFLKEEIPDRWKADPPTSTGGGAKVVSKA